jgi:multiple sugar transport system permease protein
MSGAAMAEHSLQRRYVLRRRLHVVGQVLLGLIILIWTLLPIYNMVEVGLSPKSGLFKNELFPSQPTLMGFWDVLTQNSWFVEHFWHEMGNSLYIAVFTAVLTLAIGSLTSFVIGRMRIRGAWMVSNAALITYVIPAAFLAIPFYSVMKNYGLGDNLWAVIMAEVTFATPYAIFIFTEYGTSIPVALDEAARIDGAGPFGVYWYVYLPMMAPAMVAVGTYALLLAWNEYLYLYLLLSSAQNMTVPVALGNFLNSDEAPWNLMMATAFIYALPPVVIYYAFRRYIATGLTMGGVKG